MGGAQWTLAEASRILSEHGRPVTASQLRQFIAALAWQPAGRRYTGRKGKPQHTYHAGELMRLHKAISSWLPTDLTS